MGTRIWTLNTAFLVLMSVGAAWLDLRHARIPNRLTVTGFALALLTRLLLGWRVFGLGVLGGATAAILSIPLFLARALGGGDVKLLIAVGAFLGPQRFMIAVLVTAAAGALLSVIEATRRGVILPALMNVRDFFKYWLTLGRRGTRPQFMSAQMAKVPYGVAIALGALIARFW